MQTLPIKKLRETARIPTRATAGSAGYDLYACLTEAVTIPARGRGQIPTGIAISIGDPGVAAFVFGRSGLGIKQGIVPANAVGVVDSDYRGEIIVGLANHSDSDFTVRHGDRIAQMVLLPMLTPTLVEQDELDETERGTGGFGSTGK
ncbi:dUTP diphosphatase [Ruminococcaceae bacterium OttesenSCG-928-L11]|nr:dUTP diphosphatase [Ruminococcaceae bacterium OttesenSCG-928-L11]